MIYHRLPVLVLLVSCFLVATQGCGSSNSVSSPESDELTQYLNENPDAPKSGSEAPAGIDGPTGLPGEAGQ